MSGMSNPQKGQIAGLERVSGLSWAEWVAAFEAAGARSLAHPEIAKIALEIMPEGVKNPGWWAQGAAIGYEYEVGIRVPGQSSTGSFRVNASRTMPGDRDAAIEAWAAAYGDADQLGHEVRDQRTSRTEKRTFWRATLEGAGKLDVAASAKGEGKVLIALQHLDLEDDLRLAEWKAHWKALLADLKL